MKKILGIIFFGLFIIIFFYFSGIKWKNIKSTNLLDSIDNVLTESQILEYDEDRDPWYGKEEKFSIVNVPKHPSLPGLFIWHILLNKIEVIQLTYDNKSRIIHYVGHVRSTNNFNKCLTFRKKEKDNFFKLQSFNKSNLIIIKPFKHTDVFQHLTDNMNYRVKKDQSIISFSCLDKSKSIMKNKPSNNFEYRFEYISQTFNVWLTAKDKKEKSKSKN